MTDHAVARLFMHGRSQAVRLPRAFRMPGDRVRVRRVAGGGLLLEPIIADTGAWFAALDRFAQVPSMKDGRRQPPLPPPADVFDEPAG